MRALLCAVRGLLICATAFTARAADACLDIPCGETGTHAGPANLGVLVHVDRTSTSPVLSLTNAAGTNVEVSIVPEGHVPGVFLVTPSVPLAADQVFVAKPAPCGRPDGRVVVAAPVPLPSAVGALVVTAPQDGSGSGCIPMPARGRSVDIRLDAHSSFKNYESVTSMDWLVDGKPYRDPVTQRGAGLALTSTTLRADCGNTNPAFLTASVHEVELRAWVPLRPMLTARATVDLSCPSNETAEAPGCSCADAPRPGSNLWFLLAVPLVVGARRRRARRLLMMLANTKGCMRLLDGKYAITKEDRADGGYGVVFRIALD